MGHTTAGMVYFLLFLFFRKISNKYKKLILFKGGNMILNGKTVDLKEEISVEQLLKDYDLNPQKVVVEVNMEILDDEVYSTYLLKNEDTVEVISFVGGG